MKLIDINSVQSSQGIQNIDVDYQLSFLKRFSQSSRCCQVRMYRWNLEFRINQLVLLKKIKIRRYFYE